MGRPKNKKEHYYCEYCDFNTPHKRDWDRHLKTAKHKRNLKISFEFSKNKQGLILCNFCGKTYKHRSSYSRHKKKCEALHKKDANFEAENANKKSEIQLSQMDTKSILQKIENIETKIENNLNIKNLNNNITINMFLNEHCKNALNLEDFIEKIKITLNDLMETKSLGFSKGLSNILIKNINQLPTVERPIHCIDKKALEFVVKEHDEWKSEGGNKKVDKVIKSCMEDRIKKLSEWKKANPNYMNDEKLYQTYNEIISNIMDAAGEGDVEEDWQTNVKKDLGEALEIDKAISEVS